MSILLILSILTVQEAQQLYDFATQLGLDVLVEVHSDEDLERLKQLKNVKMIGINNRNLSTFDVDVNHCIDVKKQLEDVFSSTVFVAESGIVNSHDCDRISNSGFNAVLIGEGLVTNSQLGSYFSL